MDTATSSPAFSLERSNLAPDQHRSDCVIEPALAPTATLIGKCACDRRHWYDFGQEVGQHLQSISGSAWAALDHDDLSHLNFFEIVDRYVPGDDLLQVKVRWDGTSRLNLYFQSSQGELRLELERLDRTRRQAYALWNMDRDGEARIGARIRDLGDEIVVVANALGSHRFYHAGDQEPQVRYGEIVEELQSSGFADLSDVEKETVAKLAHEWDSSAAALIETARAV